MGGGQKHTLTFPIHIFRGSIQAYRLDTLNVSHYLRACCEHGTMVFRRESESRLIHLRHMVLRKCVYID